MHSAHTYCDMCAVRERSICAALDDEELRKLLKISRRKHYNARQPIFMDGDEAEQCFNIIYGIVKLVKTLADGEQHIIGLLYPPDFLGQPLGRRHTYSAETATGVELCCFPRAPFQAFLATHPELQRRMLELTLRELDHCRDWTLLLGRKSSYERVAGFLLMMARRIPGLGGCSPGDMAHFQMPFTRSEMADYLGLTLETVSRQLSRLKNRKVILLPSSRDIVVPSIKALGAIADIETCLPDVDQGQGQWAA